MERRGGWGGGCGATRGGHLGAACAARVTPSLSRLSSAAGGRGGGGGAVHLCHFGLRVWVLVGVPPTGRAECVERCRGRGVGRDRERGASVGRGQTPWAPWSVGAPLVGAARCVIAPGRPCGCLDLGRGGARNVVRGGDVGIATPSSARCAAGEALATAATVWSHWPVASAQSLLGLLALSGRQLGGVGGVPGEVFWRGAAVLGSHTGCVACAT